MKLYQILDQLTSSELSRHSMGTDLDNGFIKSTHLKRIVSMINLGIITLFTKFHLAEEQVIVQLYSGITMYKLNHKFASTNTDANNTSIRYITDSIYRPFHEDQLVKIITVHDEAGREKFLNDNNERFSVFTPSSHVLQHPFPAVENAVAIMYQAKPRPFPVPTCTEYGDGVTAILDDCREYIEISREIPDTILPALLYFVASRVHINLSNNDSMVEANFFKNKYLVEVDNLSNIGVSMPSYYADDSVINEGWV